MNWSPKENSADYRLKVNGDNVTGLEARKQGDIPTALEQLHEVAAGLEKAVESLANRLQSVIKPEPCDSKGDTPQPEPLRSPVANGICAAANNVHDSVMRLRRLESLVQL